MNPTIKGRRTFRRAQSSQNTKTIPKMKTRSCQCFLIAALAELKSDSYS